MPLCGFDAKMLQGLTLFAQGLYESALRLSEEKGIAVDEAMQIEIKEMNVFLGALEEKYQALRKTHGVDEAMRELTEWTAMRDKNT